MSSFKGDPYFAAHADFLECRDSSEEESTGESEVQSMVERNRDKWVLDHYDALEELYNIYKTKGKILFANAFHQFGGFIQFAHFVYRFSIPH